MSDFYSILKQSIIDRGLRSARDREVAYAQARTAMVRRLWSYEPPLSEDEIDSRIGQFDRAVDRIEEDVVEVFASLPEPATVAVDAPGTAPPAPDGYDEDADYAPPFPMAPAQPPAIGRSGGVDGLAGLFSNLEMRSLAVERALNADPSGSGEDEDEDEEDDALATDARLSYEAQDLEEAELSDGIEPEPPYRLPAPYARQGPPDPGDLRPTMHPVEGASDSPGADQDFLEDGRAIVERRVPRARRRPTEAVGGRAASSGKSPAQRTGRQVRRTGQRDHLARQGNFARAAAGVSAAAKAAVRRRRDPVLLAAAVASLGIGLAGLIAWVLWTPASPAPPALATAAPPPPPVAATGTGGPLPVAAGRLPSSSGAERYMVFDGGDPTVFEADPSNPVRFDGRVARVSTSAGSAGARVLVGPGLATRLAGRNIRLSMMVRSARENGAASLRVAYQSGLAVSHWQTVNLSSEFGPLELVWRVPALRTDPTGNTIIVEPGIPGDGTAAEIGAIAVDILD